MASLRFLVLVLLALGSGEQAIAQDQVQIILRAFIPNTYPGSENRFRPFPDKPGKVLLNSPLPIGNCFETDHRTFSTDPHASARVTANFTMVAKTPPEVRPSAVKDRFKTGVTHEIDCAAGKVLKTATASTANCTMGAPAMADNKLQIVLSCKASNPLISFAPDIHFGGSFTYDASGKTISFTGDVGAFPSFEAYASLNNKGFVKIFTLTPGANAGPLSLFDLWQHVNTRRVEVKSVKLN